MVLLLAKPPNGMRYLRVGGRGFCLRVGKSWSQKNAPKSRRFPHVRYTLCWKALRKARWSKTKSTPSTPKTRPPTDKIIARTSLFRKNQNPHAKLLRKRLDPGTELKFTKTFAEETQPFLNTRFDQTRFYFNETQTIVETLKKPTTKRNRGKEPAQKWLDQKVCQITANDNWPKLRPTLKLKLKRRH